jgi:hypothetical protein
MSAVVIQAEERVRIPEWVVDLDSFCRWAGSDEFPQRGWYSFFNNEVWVDVSMEAIDHNLIKVDPRGPKVRFQILRHAPKGYVAVRPQNGWLRSEVFDRSFRLTQQTDEDRLREYTLHVR